MSTLSWEEITANIEKWKAANAEKPTIAKDTYLDEIQQVNSALQQGIIISIRVYYHGYTSLPSPPEAIPLRSDFSSSFPPPGGCLLILKKVLVEFLLEKSHYRCCIALQFLDVTHNKEVISGTSAGEP